MEPSQVEVMTTPTAAGTVICITQMFLYDDIDIDIDLWSLYAESVRKYSCAAETVNKMVRLQFLPTCTILIERTAMGRRFSCW